MFVHRQVHFPQKNLAIFRFVFAPKSRTSLFVDKIFFDGPPMFLFLFHYFIVLFFF